MQMLCVYIDRWHLTGALFSNEDVHPLEDKYWFYFHENIDTGLVEYGRSNEMHFLNKEEHYIGDIFTLVTDPRETFCQYGHQVEIKLIFSASGMLEDLAKSTGIEGEIDTYISFAEEVPDAARLVLIETMEAHRFVVKEKVARIEHLLLENAKKQGKITDEGHYLVLNAATHDLRYSMYLHSGGFFVEEKNATLPGLGTDPRGRALVEAVVEKMNQRLRMLFNQNEFERERMRLSRLYLDGWLTRLTNIPENLPVTFSNVSFSIAPNNRENVMILVKDINQRTRSIVAQIVQEVAGFVGETARADLKSVLFLGDVFSNENFVREILSRFSVERSQLFRFRNTDIPFIVSMYSRIDCGQFSAANERFEVHSEAERKRIQNAIEEKERQQRASVELENARKKEDEKRSAEKSYREAMEHVYEFERKGDYEQMKEWCEVALMKKSDDEAAKGKLDDALRLLSEEKLRHEQYNEALRKAKVSLEEGRFQDALSQSEVALASMPDSAEAKRILSLSKEKINNAAQINRLIDRVDLFLAQNLFVEALNELYKILAIDPDNQEAKKKKNETETILLEKQSQITSLEHQFQQAKGNSDFSKAKETLEKLIAVDQTNQLKWSALLQDVKHDEVAAVEKAQKLSSLKKQIENAVFEEQWSDVVALCKASLEVTASEEIHSILLRAESKIAKIKEEEALKAGIDAVKALIAEKNLNEARIKLNELKKKYPHRDDLFKPLYKAMFDAEDIVRNRNTSETKPKKPIGFNNKPNFFDTDSSPVKKTSPSKVNHTHQKPPKTGDDFFDMDIPVRKSKDTKQKDFNF